MSRGWIGVAAVLGGLAVVLGAFGAHGLQAWLATVSDGAQRLQWWRTASSYHLWHALALGLVAVVRAQLSAPAAHVAPWAFMVGIVLFSGSLYVMTLTGVRVLGAVTPFGGVALIVGWAALAWGALRSRPG